MLLNNAWSCLVLFEEQIITYHGDAEKAIITSETAIYALFEKAWDFWTNPAEIQRNGWQAILDNFKKHVETS